VLGVERLHGLTCERSQTFNACLTARRTLVDGRLPFSDCAGIGSAIWKAATCALGLRQRIVQQ
jgi:hypothetical protein